LIPPKKKFNQKNKKKTRVEEGNLICLQEASLKKKSIPELAFAWKGRWIIVKRCGPEKTGN